MKAQKKAAPVPKENRLAEVYRAAAQIILRKGYDATSINDIANELGITRVPSFLMDSKFMVSGAQGTEQILDTLQRAWARRAA